MPCAPLPPADPHRQIRWAHGTAEWQTVGGMLATVAFLGPGQPDFSPLQVALWAEEPDADRWPGALRRRCGEWASVPFGRCDRRDTALPVARYPTRRLDLGRVQLALAHAGPGLTDPVPAESGRSRVRADAGVARLQAVPLARRAGAASLSAQPRAARGPAAPAP